MKYLAILFFVLVVPFNTSKILTKNPPTVVLQLFTSQGCSSCPAADVLLEYIQKDFKSHNVIVLSYHVDYWNYIGWKDPYSKNEFTNLQYNYGRKLNLKRVYTPQLIINGKEHYVGSSKGKIYKSIKRNLKSDSENTLELNQVVKTNNKIDIEYNTLGSLKDKRIQLALVLNEKTTHIKRGENENRALTNSNIVVQTKSIALNASSGELTIDIPTRYKDEKGLKIIGFIEDNELNISGATEIQVN